MATVLGEFKAGSSDWQTLIEQLDTNNDGKIDYGEFISAAVNRATLLSKQNLEIAFKMFDADGNGVISINELKDVFSGVHELTSEEDNLLWNQILQEVDTNHDSVISHEEFFTSMQAVLD